MVPPLARILVLSIVMTVGTLLAAFAPMFLSLSPSRVQTISTYGTGLLIGAALTVIIPEGVEQMYAGSKGEELSGWLGGSLLLGFLMMYLIDSFQPHETTANPSRSPQIASRGHQRRRSASLYHSASFIGELEPLAAGEGSDREHEASGSYEWDEHASPQATPRVIQRTSSPPVGASPSEAFSTVVGLLAHSLADGISLGASAVTPDLASSDSPSQGLDIIIFIAIMVHKAPTAFALCSLLLSSNQSHPFIRRCLVAFSLAAPVGALLTYLILSLFGGASDGATMAGWTGLVLVFSGGSFLFVSTHVMERKESDGQSAPASAGKHQGLSKAALVVGGMITPGLLTRLVGHGH